MSAAADPTAAGIDPIAADAEVTAAGPAVDAAVDAAGPPGTAAGPGIDVAGLPGIAAVDATLSLGGRRIVRGISLDVRPGEVLAVVGPNGAGKSTMVALLGGDRAPDSGSVSIAGRESSAWRTRDLARVRSVLPQHNTVSFPFTVRAVVEMGRAPWAGTPSAAADQHVVHAAMAATSVVDLADRVHTTLSGGERARVALARVLAQDTPIVLLDEPTAALDLRHQDLVLRIAVEQARAGRAVMIVLHDLTLAAAYTDRIAVLSHGLVAACGPPADVLTADLVSSVYAQPVEVIPHPTTGVPLVLPIRH